MMGSGAGSGSGGTVTHVAPEMWLNINIKPSRSYDVYAMGVLMWEIFTETEPYTGEGGRWEGEVGDRN
jgi:serine/threonine protein kinase